MHSRIINQIALDLDGTLLDGRLRHYHCYRDILESHGFYPLPVDEYWEMKRQRRSRKAQLAATGAESIYSEFLAAWMERIEKPEYLRLDRIQDGALTRLQEWRDAGLNVVLVTLRSNRATLMEQLQWTGLLPFFSSVVICPPAGGGEGKAAGLLREFPGVESASCLWVGDTEADAEGAMHLGCPVWLLWCGLRSREFLSSLHPDFLTASIRDVDLGKVVLNVS